MGVENLRSLNAPPVLGDLIPDCVYEGVWFYKKRNGESFFNFVGTEIEATKLAQEKGISPKKTLFNRTLVGWLLTVQTNTKGLFLSAWYGVGEEGMVNEIYVLKKDPGGVVTLTRPRGKEASSVLDSDPNEVVFAPVFPRRGRRGGVLVLAARDLLVPQNVKIITGSL